MDTTKLSPNQKKAIKAHERLLHGRALMYRSNIETKARSATSGVEWRVKIAETGDDFEYIAKYILHFFWADRRISVAVRDGDVYAVSTRSDA